MIMCCKLVIATGSSFNTVSNTTIINGQLQVLYYRRSSPLLQSGWRYAVKKIFQPLKTN